MTRGGRWRRVFRLDVGRGHVERDVDEEIAFHLAMRAEKLRQWGVDAERATGQALSQFGDLQAVRDACVSIDRDKERAVRRGTRMGQIARDVGYAVRALRHHAGFSAVVVLTLALGIGANATIFSVVEALLLRPIPVAHPEQLVSIGDTRRVNSLSVGPPRTDLFSYPLYQDLRDNNTVFSGLYGNSTAGSLALTTGPGAGVDSASAPAVDHPRGRFVTANYFQVLGVRAARGRVFAPDEDRVPGTGAVTVISDRYWQREFNRDPNVVGRTVSVNGVPMTVVGVTPPSFTGDLVAQRTDLWIPVSMQPSLNPTQHWLNDRSVSWLLLMGRRKPGVSFSQARDQMVALTRRMLDAAGRGASGERPSRSQYEHVPVAPGGRGFSYWRAEFTNSLYTLTVAVGLVLLIVCANVANLMLGRAASRSREIGVRLALGAGRWRIVQQLMVESLILAITGAGLGLWLAHGSIAVLLRALSGGDQVLPIGAGLNGTVLGFAAVLSVGTALVFGLAPALRATRVNLSGVLRSHARGVTGGWRRFRAGRALVMAQVALSLMMLVATGMVLRSLRALETRDMGLDRDHLLVVGVSAEPLKLTAAGLSALRVHLREALSSVPGVAAVSYSTNGIFSGSESVITLEAPGFVSRTEADSSVNFDAIGPGYFRAIGARMLQGRDIAPGEGDRSPRAAVVNAAFVTKYFPHGGAVGRQVSDGEQEYEIVGVAAGVHDHDLRGTPPARLYAALGGGNPDFVFEVRAAGDPAAIAEPVRRALTSAAPELRVDDDQPLTVLTRKSIRQDILMARFVSGFGVLALVLAAMGLYGIMSYATLQRTGEFGLRMALGAQPGDIVRMVLRDGLQLIAFGFLAGIPLLIVGVLLLRSQLFGVGPLDPASIAFAVGVLGVSAVVAGLLPAWRAARVGPLVALQTE